MSPVPWSGAVTSEMLREALCANCGKRTGPNIICGWSICPACRAGERRDWSAVKSALTSSGAKYVQRTIRDHLRRQK